MEPEVGITHYLPEKFAFQRSWMRRYQAARISRLFNVRGGHFVAAEVCKIAAERDRREIVNCAGTAVAGIGLGPK